jgi:mono/diheme cytochrome c family protein
MKQYLAKRKLFHLLIPALTLLLGSAVMSSCYYDNEEYLYPPSGQQVICDTLSPTYAADIAPIFANSCNGCHGSSAPSGNIITSDYTNLSANINKVWLSINHLPGAQAMPQGGGKLSDCDLAKIRQWRTLGMPDN